MVPHQMLVERLDREARLALAIEPLHLLRPVGGDPPARRLAEPAVGEASLALLLVSSASSAGTSARSSAASSWFSSADSQRFRTFKNIAMRTPSRASVRRIQPPQKGPDLPDRSCVT
jgi:hypothetical protein